MAHANECGIVKNSFHFLSQQANYFQYALHSVCFVLLSLVFLFYQFRFSSIWRKPLQSHSFFRIVYFCLFFVFFSYFLLLHIKRKIYLKYFYEKYFIPKNGFLLCTFIQYFICEQIYSLDIRIGNMRKENIYKSDILPKYNLTLLIKFRGFVYS